MHSVDELEELIEAEETSAVGVDRSEDLVNDVLGPAVAEAAQALVELVRVDEHLRVDVGVVIKDGDHVGDLLAALEEQAAKLSAYGRSVSPPELPTCH